MPKTPSNSWRYAHSVFFKDKVSTLDNALRLLGLIGLFMTATKLGREITGAWPGQREFVVYLFLSYSVTVVGLAIGVVLLRSLWVSRKETFEQLVLFAELNHQTAEIVRKHTCDYMNGSSPKLLQDDTTLHNVVKRVADYLEQKTGDSSIKVAVKLLANASGETKIEAVFRGPMPDATPFDRVKTINANDSVVYMQFQEGNRQIKRVIIRDTERLDTDPAAGASDAKIKRNLAYQAYAKGCHFRSVLALPLRQPASDGEFAINSVLGFLSFDSPDPNAFDNLFDKDPKVSVGNDGRGLKDRGELQALFGLADSIATLAVLAQKRSAQTAQV